MTVLAMLLAVCAVVLASRDRLGSGQRLTSAVGRRAVSGTAAVPGLVGPPAQTHRATLWSRHGIPVFAAVSAASALRAGPWLIVVMGALAALASVLRERSRLRVTHAATAAAVPAACQVLAAELLAGALPADALCAAAAGVPKPLAEQLRAAASADRLGASAASILARPPPGCEAMRAVAVCWEVSIGTGAGLAHSLERLVVVLTADIEARATVDAELAGVRLSAVVMACLPLFGLALGAALGAEPIAFLVGTPGGRLCLTAAAVLDSTGLWWVQRLGVRAAR